MWLTFASIQQRRVSSSGKWRSWPGRSRSHLSSSVRIRSWGSMTALVFGDLVKVFKQTDQMMLWLSNGRSQSKHLNVGSSSAGLWLVSRCFCHWMKLLLRAFRKAQYLSYVNISLLLIPFRLYQNMPRNNKQQSHAVWYNLVLNWHVYLFLSSLQKPSRGSSLLPGGMYASQVRKKRSNFCILRDYLTNQASV